MATPGTAAGTEPVITQMLAMLELGVVTSQRPRRTDPAILDRSFLGSSVNLNDLHPRTREFFAGTVHDFEEFNKVVLLDCGMPDLIHFRHFSDWIMHFNCLTPSHKSSIYYSFPIF